MDIIDVYKSTFSFKPSASFRWSPDEETVYFNRDELATEAGKMSLLHEIAHGLLGHVSFAFDVDLITLEREAWQKARELGNKHGVEFTEEDMQAALETYRNWLHVRSTCPTCTQTALETAPQHYHCSNCQTSWRVSPSQICQIQRRRIKR